jgi:drug/metabolite transporter (DMT)-like permease
MRSRLIFAVMPALGAAIGNALFVYGQKRSEIVENPFLFLLCTLTVCTSLFACTIGFFPKVSVGDYLSKNYAWIVLSGIGFYMTFIGFYVLYTRYGASYYVLYAVLSIITTSIIVGVILFKERINMYYGLTILSALITIVLFAIAQSKALGE